MYPAQPAGYLMHDRNIDKVDRDDNTIGRGDDLMNAARTANEGVIMMHYLNELDLTSVDEDGNTALHIAAMREELALGVTEYLILVLLVYNTRAPTRNGFLLQNDHAFICRMLIVLSSPVRIWEVKNNAGLTAEDLATDQKVKQDLESLRKGVKRTEYEFTKWNDDLIEKRTDWKENGKVLLALDGGGVKALVLTQILLFLENELGGNLMSRIDWIAGTSSGGTTALMLCHGKTLQEAKRFFLDYRFRVFCGNKVKVPKHNSKGVEDAAKVLFGNNHMGSFPKNGPKVLVVVADTRRSPANLVLFRSFAPKIPESLREQLDYLDPEKILIWKAARCTCAAPFYFDSYNGLSDGGLVANNPTQALIADFLQTTRLEKEYSPVKSVGLDPCMACVISVGTGSSPAENTNGIDLNFNIISNKKNPLEIARGFMTVVNNAKNMLQILVRECTSSSGQPVRYSREWCHSLNVPFFRFSPVMQKGVQLDNTDLDILIQMLWETEVIVIYGG
ncbi:phospholipase, patatin family [Necator americanus]|uniref:Phospholipase, patatin family n=1 Tax=Necator americanus TaxID=51031 RepID=W2SLJ8_NECAM|nr:phospholipase, patatin family [Necator americanus]ETN70544.1 phospholipase, patatin family [Necator americanus]